MNCHASSMKPRLCFFNEKREEVSLLALIRLSQKQNKQDDRTYDRLRICGNLDTNRKHETSMLWVRGHRRLKSVT